MNECVTDKRLEGSSPDFVTADELAQLLRLGDRCKTFLLLLIQCGRLRALDVGSSAAAPGAARYKIAGGIDGP